MKRTTPDKHPVPEWMPISQKICKWSIKNMWDSKRNMRTKIVQSQYSNGFNVFLPHQMRSIFTWPWIQAGSWRLVCAHAMRNDVSTVQYDWLWYCRVWQWGNREKLSTIMLSLQIKQRTFDNTETQLLWCRFDFSKVAPWSI